MDDERFRQVLSAFRDASNSVLELFSEVARFRFCCADRLTSLPIPL